VGNAGKAVAGIWKAPTRPQKVASFPSGIAPSRCSVGLGEEMRPTAAQECRTRGGNASDSATDGAGEVSDQVSDTPSDSLSDTLSDALFLTTPDAPEVQYLELVQVA
jgi:hypothetical protein